MTMSQQYNYSVKTCVIILLISSLVVYVEGGQWMLPEGSESVPEFRIKVTNLAAPLRTVRINPLSLCPNYPILWDNHVDAGTPLTAIIYTYQFTKHDTKGVLVTAYRVKTKCTVGFWGGHDKELLSDSVARLDEVDPGYLNSFKYDLIEKLKQGVKGSLDLLYSDPDSLYNCVWCSTNENVKFILRAQIVDVRWRPNGELIQPVKSSDCLESREAHQCQLHNSSILFVPANAQASKCSFSPLASLPVSVHADKDFSYVKVEAMNTEYSLDIQIINGQPDTLCHDKVTAIYVSMTGQLIGFGIPDLMEALYQHHNRTKIRESPPQEGLFRFKRDNTNPPDEVTIYPVPPPIRGLLVNPHQYRHKRSNTIWDFPEAQRDQLLYEMTVSGFSKVSGRIEGTSTQVTQSMLMIKHLNCLMKQNLYAVARTLTKDAYPLASIILDDTQISVVGRKGHFIWLHTTQMVGAIKLPDLNLSKWCNGSLLVKYSLLDQSELLSGWLMNERGLITPIDSDKPTYCLNSDQPSVFNIPTFLHGSFNYLTKSLHFNVSLPSDRAFIMNFITSSPDSGDAFLHDLETGQSLYEESRTTASPLSQAWRTLKFPTDPSLIGLSMLTSNLILPLLSAALIGVIIRFVLPCLRGCNEGPSRTHEKLRWM